MHARARTQVWSRGAASLANHQNQGLVSREPLFVERSLTDGLDRGAERRPWGAWSEKPTVARRIPNGCFRWPIADLALVRRSDPGLPSPNSRSELADANCSFAASRSLGGTSRPWWFSSRAQASASVVGTVARKSERGSADASTVIRVMRGALTAGGKPSLLPGGVWLVPASAKKLSPGCRGVEQARWASSCSASPSTVRRKQTGSSSFRTAAIGFGVGRLVDLASLDLRGALVDAVQQHDQILRSAIRRR
jgi:hypothetical protein